MVPSGKGTTKPGQEFYQTIDDFFLLSGTLVRFFTQSVLFSDRHSGRIFQRNSGRAAANSEEP